MHNKDNFPRQVMALKGLGGLYKAELGIKSHLAESLA